MQMTADEHKWLFVAFAFCCNKHTISFFVWCQHTDLEPATTLEKHFSLAYHLFLCNILLYSVAICKIWLLYIVENISVGLTLL